MSDPFELLRKHAESRKRMTKAELLADAEMGDEAYINMACEKDMAEAYYKDLEAELAALRVSSEPASTGLDVLDLAIAMQHVDERHHDPEHGRYRDQWRDPKYWEDDAAELAREYDSVRLSVSSPQDDPA